VLARDEMAARARAAEARLSDALHERLTERFVNRRTSILMKTMGKDSALLRVALDDEERVSVEGEHIGHLEGFRFVVDAEASSEDRKLMLAAAEKHLPQLLHERAKRLVENELGELRIERGKLLHDRQTVATLEPGRSRSRPRLRMAKELGRLDPAHRDRLGEALDLWLDDALAPLAPLRAIEQAALDPGAGSEVRALLLTLADRGGTVERERAGLAVIAKDKRPLLRRLGVTIGALDVFVPALLKPAPRALLHAIGADGRPLREAMEAVIPGAGALPAGYRRAGKQAIRVDMAEKLFRFAHEQRASAGGRAFSFDKALATSMGLAAENLVRLMRDAGFRPEPVRPLGEGAYGPPAPALWTWRAPRKDRAPRSDKRPRPRDGNAFAGLAELLG
jgi:ATP-dependent RNA helicase SUPV3L1/SUV3